MCWSENNRKLNYSGRCGILFFLPEAGIHPGLAHLLPSKTWALSIFLFFHPQYVGFVLFLFCLMITTWLLDLQALPLSSKQEEEQKEKKKKKQEGEQGEGSRPAQSVPFVVGKQRPFWGP